MIEKMVESLDILEKLASEFDKVMEIWNEIGRRDDKLNGYEEYMHQLCETYREIGKSFSGCTDMILKTHNNQKTNSNLED